MVRLISNYLSCRNIKWTGWPQKWLYIIFGKSTRSTLDLILTMHLTISEACIEMCNKLINDVSGSFAKRNRGLIIKANLLVKKSRYKKCVWWISIVQEKTLHVNKQSLHIFPKFTMSFNRAHILLGNKIYRWNLLCTKFLLYTRKNW